MLRRVSDFSLTHQATSLTLPTHAAAPQGNPIRICSLPANAHPARLLII
ncbi:hypothetical protein [Cupriavidus sp. UYPR2.512]|nr:hypothetical protein [Cupriavidus sp. UYPR2.512]UIF89794.1 hypothetical protein KAF44_39055 [Cupriavidus necator]